MGGGVEMQRILGIEEDQCVLHIKRERERKREGQYK
jgi:hypothetical protein